MEQIKVPQDVQRADKILGPLTVIQLAILVGSLLLAWLVYTVLQTEIAIPLVVIIVIVALAFTFLKIHTWPFHTFLRATLYLMLVPRVRTWQKMRDSIQIPVDEIMKIQLEKQKTAKKIEQKTKSKKQVDDIASVLDAQGGLKNKLSDADHIDQAEDKDLLQAAYFGPEHDHEAQQKRVNKAINSQQS